MRKLKSTKTPNPHARKILIQSKVNSEEMRTILSKSHSWTGGNISELIRIAVLKFTPTKGDFQK